MTETQVKTCANCENEKPVEEFHKRKDRGDGFQSYCKMCAIALRKRKYDSQIRYDQNLRLKYGITLGQYDEMLEEQGGVCLICKTHPEYRRLDVDHDHDTGEVRGLVCSACNFRIGHVETVLRDFPQILKYLMLSR